MCLGASARAANENARRRYAYENERRERQWMQTLSVYNAQKVKYSEDLVNLGLAQNQSVLDKNEAMDAARGTVQLKYAELYRTLIKDSTYSKLAASGQTGQSTRRIGTMEFAKYGRDISNLARKLTLNDRELERKSQKEMSQYQTAKNEAFSKVAFQPIPDVEPPQPVMQNVGAAMFMDALSIGSSLTNIVTPCL